MGKRRLTTVKNSSSLNSPVLGSQHEISLAETDLFSMVPYQQSVLRSYWSVFYPETGSLVSTNPDISFNIGPSPHCSNLANSFIRLEVQLTKEKDPQKQADTDEIKAADKVCPANFVAASLFKDIQLYISGKPIASNYGLSYYEAYIRMLTQLSHDAMNKWELAGYYPDRIMTQIDGTAVTDPAIHKRYQRFGLGQKQVIYCPIFTPMAFQTRLIPSLVDLKLVYTKGPETWQFFCPANNNAKFHMKILDAQLHVQRTVLYPARARELESKLNSGQQCRFFIENSYLRYFPLDSGTKNFRVANILLNSYLPQHIYFALISLKDLKGLKNVSNFNFAHYKLSALSVRSGENVWPKNGPFKPTYTDDPDTSIYAREFFSLYSDSLGGLAMKADSGLALSYKAYHQGSCVYKIDFQRNEDVSLIG